jgi:PAS domain S-box-containing protein
MVLTHSTARTFDSRQRRARTLDRVLVGLLLSLGVWAVGPVLLSSAAWRQEQTAIAVGTIGAILIAWLIHAYVRIARSEASLAARNAERARAIEALRESENRFRDWAEISCEWFWEQNAELRYTRFSDTVSRPGLRFDLIGLTRWEMVTEGVTEEEWARHKAQLAAGQPFRDFRYIRTGEDGEIHHISVSGKPIFDANGRFCGYRGAGREITAEVHAAEALRRAKTEAEAAGQRLSDAIESISEGFVLFDREDRYVLTNSNYLRLYPGIEDLCTPGHTFEAAMRANIERNLHKFGPAGAEAWFRQIMAWHRACDAPMEQQLTDGRWIRAVERRTRDGDVVGIRTDITATKAAEAALLRKVGDLEAAQARLERLSGDLAEMTGDLRAARDAAEEKAAELAQSEARFRDFALTSSHWLWETDAQHRFAYVSEGVRTFGWSIENLIGRRRFEIAADAGSDPEKWHAYQALLDRHEPFRDFMYGWKNTTGEKGFASVSGDPFVDGKGRFLGFRGTGRDITRQVRAENALREAKQAAEAASHAKSQFLANMSHELRTPLNAIIGFSEIIKLGMKGPISPDYHEYAELIHQSGQHLYDVINDILELAKVDAGKFELHEEPGVDPCLVAEACVDLVREHAERGGIRLSIEIGERPPLLVADPIRLKQILLNLLSNAIKFTPPGGSVVVAIGCSQCGGALLHVRDSGAGMTAPEIAIALEPFGQVDDGLDRRHEGTGLGLPLARRLAELHGGALAIDSEKGRGTTVKLTLPAPPPGGVSIPAYSDLNHTGKA